MNRFESGIGQEAIILERSGLRVKDIVHNDLGQSMKQRGGHLLVIPADEPVSTAAKAMARRNCSALLVEEQGKVVGVITREEIAKAYMNWIKVHL